MASKGVILGVVAILVLGGIIVMNPGLLKQNSVTDTTHLGTGADPNITKVQSYKGPLDVNQKGSDTIATATTYTDGTNYVVNYYKKVNDVPVFITASANNTAPIDIELSDKTIWAEVVIPSGQAFYVDGAGIAQSHVRVGDPVICDYNNDNIDTYCFPLDVTGYTADDQNPGFTWFVRLYDEGSIALNSPSNVTGLGTGKVACTINWEGSMDNEGDAEYLTKVVLTLNATEADDYWFPADSWLKVDGNIFVFDENGFEGADHASTYTYTLRLADDYLTQWKGTDDKGAILLKYPINGDNQFNFDSRIYTNFASAGEALSATLALTTENAQGTQTTVSDAVLCQGT
jgi:hypothetical protein